MAWSAGQKYFAEYLGTFALLLFGGGAAVFSHPAFDADARVVLVSAAFGLTVLGAAYAFGDVSGGHFNPAVTLSMALSRKMPGKDVLPYIGAQILGGLTGVAVLIGIAQGNTPQYNDAQSIAFGSQCYSASFAPPGCEFTIGSVFLIELAATFTFVLVIHLVTRPDGTTRNLAPVAIGLTLMVANLLAIPVDGASLNPVRSFSPALWSAMWTSAHWALEESWLFWVAPVLGGLLASVVEMRFRSGNA
jgi:aquaporin Z